MSKGYVTEWDVKTVVQWVQSQEKFSHLSPHFEEEEIDGATLIDLTTEDLKSLGLTKLGPLKEFQKLVSSLAAPLSVEPSSHASSDGDLPNISVESGSPSFRSDSTIDVPLETAEWDGLLKDLTLATNSDAYSLHPKSNQLRHKACEAANEIGALLDDIMFQSGAGVHSQLSGLGVSALKADLQRPQQALKRMDFSIAVIGLMKVGKSTLINAVLGQMLSPSRSLPMTTLPTLYRHRPGQHLPVLSVHHEPITRWIARVRQRHQLDEIFTLSRHLDLHLRQTLEQVLQPSFELLPVVEGTLDIAEHLFLINDVLRIAERLRDRGVLLQDNEGVIEGPSPLEELIALQAYPLIEVEFTCLRSMPESLGTLTLVDTPGPDEAGQPVLEKAVKATLRQASAVLAVLDYTRLGNQADVEMRQKFVGFFREEHGGRGKGAAIADKVIVILNKYEETTEERYTFARTFVRDLFHNSGIPVAANHIFPVSAQRALLASQFYSFMAQDHRKPDSPPWMDEYTRVVYPFEDYTRVPIKECLRRNEIMWEKARMGAVLNNTIQYIFSRIVPNVISDALADAVQVLVAVRGRLTCMLKATHMTQLQIVDYANRLVAHRKLLDQTQCNVGTKLQEPLAVAKVAIEGHFKELQGRMLEALTPKCATLATTIPADVKLMETFATLLGSDQVFPDAGRAQDWLEGTFSQLRSSLMAFISQEAQVSVGHVLKGVQDCCRQLFWNLVWELHPITDDFQELDVSVDIEPFVTNFAFEDLDLSAAMQVAEESRCVIQRERRWYTLWLVGHQLEAVVEKDYRIRMEDVKRSLETLIRSALEHCSKVYTAECEKQVESFRAEFFHKVEAPLAFIEEQHQLTEEEEATQVSLGSLLEGALARVDVSMTTIRALRTELKSIFPPPDPG
eukprot:GGOE01040664.1.p1 GENE.GGOE01040664.1~~GGOE01040664.1.p1  ORF type:complete len:905 (+),score=227.73 GGOE01040664.1:43-2757(+)